VTSIPPLDCALCGRCIGSTATHWMLAGVLRRVICARCVDKHDLYDQCNNTFGNRAYMAVKLGLIRQHGGV